MIKKFTYVEALIIVALAALLLSLLFPALSKARRQANISLCQSNLYHVGIAYTLYINSNNKFYPTLKHSGYRFTMGQTALGVSAKERPLNAYYNTRLIAECPADKGQPMFNVKNVYKEWGSSYTATSNNDIQHCLFVWKKTKNH